MTGAEMVVKTLEKNGVKVVFGYPGAANCPIIDKLSFSSIKHILTRNEQGAAHMASGYARVTKQAGVCTATSGPGATNLITGIATAYMDSIPMVALTGQVATKLIGKDAFQEVDITGATLPFTKHSYLIKDGLDIPRVVNEAFHIANTGRPGPVLIDFPMDLLKKEFDYPDEETDIPVVSTMMGIGILPSDNPRYYGMIGSHGVKRANLLFNRADLVIVMGSRLGDRTVANVKGLEEGNKLIHIDLDPAEIGKNTQPYIPVVGDIKDVLEQLTSQISGYKTSKEWIDEADELRQRFTHKPVYRKWVLWLNGIFPLKWYCSKTTVLVWYTNISIFFINQIIRLLK